jgi:hypothetical protein
MSILFSGLTGIYVIIAHGCLFVLCLQGQEEVAEDVNFKHSW